MKTSSVLILLVLSLLSFKAYSAPLSCGNVREIRCPFQLKGDNQNCKGSSYEFSCENNRTILHLSPDNMQYFVEDINYDNSSLLVVDPGIRKDNYSSLPLYSMQEEPSIRGNIPLEYLNQPVTFLSCHTPAVSSQYINITSIASSSSYKYSYVVTGSITLSQVEGDCEVTKLAWVSREWPILKTDNYLTINFSELPITNFSELHDGMAYGFMMDWSKIFCASCNLRVYSLCQALNAEYTCFYDCDLYDITTDAFLPLCWRQNLHGIKEILNDHRSAIAAVAGLILAARFTIGLPFLLAVLVYRLKKRHLSVYDSIEDFLQGQNNLTPIRYSYSDVKKITNGNEIEIEDANKEEKKLVKKMIIVALWCIQMRPSERPSMHKVIEMLEGDADVLRMPPKPFLHLQEEQMEDQELISTPLLLQTDQKESAKVIAK
ncbi:hypothetical protein ACET3Z_023801 [Daucus carota]